MKKYPQSRIGWHQYYAARFNKTEAEGAMQMALFYWLLHIEHDAPPDLA